MKNKLIFASYSVKRVHNVRYEDAFLQPVAITTCGGFISLLNVPNEINRDEIAIMNFHKNDYNHCS